MQKIVLNRLLMEKKELTRHFFALNTRTKIMSYYESLGYAESVPNMQVSITRVRNLLYIARPIQKVECSMSRLVCARYVIKMQIMAYQVSNQLAVLCTELSK